MEKIPTYHYKVNNDFVITAVSMVQEPATERKAEYFDRCKANFSIQDNNIICVAVECNKPILRYGADIGYYNIVFDKKACDSLAQQILRKGLPLTLDHEEMDALPVTLTGVFQVSPAVKFQDAPDGSVIVSYSASPEVIDELKKRTGFSIEIYYRDLEPVDKVDELINFIDNDIR